MADKGFEDWVAAKFGETVEMGGVSYPTHAMIKALDKARYERLQLEYQATLSKECKTVLDVIAMNKGKKAYVFYSDTAGNIRKDAKVLSLNNNKTLDLPVASVNIRKIKGQDAIIIGAVMKRGRPITGEGRRKNIRKSNRLVKADVKIGGRLFEDFDPYGYADGYVDEDAFDELLREVYGDTVMVAWVEFDTADAIKTLDPVSYQIALGEESNNIAGEFESELDDAEAGDTIYAFGEQIEVIKKRGGMKKSFADREIEKLEKEIARVEEPTVIVSQVRNVPRGYDVVQGSGKINPFDKKNMRREDKTTQSTVKEIKLAESRERMQKYGK